MKTKEGFTGKNAAMIISDEVEICIVGKGGEVEKGIKADPPVSVGEACYALDKLAEPAV